MEDVDESTERGRRWLLVNQVMKRATAVSCSIIERFKNALDAHHS